MHPKINIGGEIYTIFGFYTNKREAESHAKIARDKGLFKSVRMVELPKTSFYRKNGKYVVAMRGVN